MRWASRRFPACSTSSPISSRAGSSSATRSRWRSPCRPAVIVLDEPTTGLDVTTQRTTGSTVAQLCTRYDVAAVYVSHDVAVVGELASRVAVLYAGRVVEVGRGPRRLRRPGAPTPARAPASGSLAGSCRASPWHGWGTAASGRTSGRLRLRAASPARGGRLPDAGAGPPGGARPRSSRSLRLRDPGPRRGGRHVAGVGLRGGGRMNCRWTGSEGVRAHHRGPGRLLRTDPGAPWHLARGAAGESASRWWGSPDPGRRRSRGASSGCT